MTASNSLAEIFAFEDLTDDVMVKSYESTNNIAACIRDTSLKNKLIDLYNNAVSDKLLINEDFFNKDSIVGLLEEITALANHLDPKEDKFLIDKCIDALSHNSNPKKFGRTINSIYNLVSIPVHSSGKAFPIHGPVIDSYYSILDKYKPFKFITKIFAGFNLELQRTLKNHSLVETLLKVDIDDIGQQILSPSLSKSSGIFSPEFKDALYERYFLNRMSPENKEILRKIRDKFGTYVFVPASTKPKVLQKAIADEFDNWSNTGGENVKFEKVLDYCWFDPAFKNLSTVGVANNLKNSLRIRYLNPKSNTKILRHERLHINDLNNMPSLSPDSKWGYFGPNKEYDFTPAGKILTEKKWFREEFVNAGLPKKTIDYAYTNRAEFIAVAVTGDMTKYSPKFKKVLIELGTPE